MSGVIQTTWTQMRWMNRGDLDAVMAIQHDQFDNPWTRGEMTIAMQQSNVVGMIAERNSETVGYMIYEVNRQHIHVLNFAVRARSQRLGVGRTMMDALKYKLHHIRNKIVLELSEANLDGQLFCRSVGFVCTEIVEDYFPESVTDEPAYRMVFNAGGQQYGG